MFPARPFAVLLFLFTLTASGVLGSAPGHAQQPAQRQRGDALPRVSPNATVSQTVGVMHIRLAYGRPGVKGREIFGGLVPYGQVWRTGANEATTITFSDDVQVEGRPLAAGTYGFFTIPGRQTWTLIFNEEADQWGAFDYDRARDALRVEVAPKEAPHPHEWMAFRVGALTDTSATISLVWDEVRVPFRIQTDTEANVRAKAEAAATGAEDWQVLLRYAAYALEHDRYRKAALRWVDRSIALEENFRNTSTKARLLAAAGRYDEARRVAERARALAERMKKAPQGLESFEERIADWPSR